MSPSHVKFVYAPQVLDFWFGLGRAGGWNLGIAIIGFSLPKDDDYVRIGLFNLIDNYQVSWWNQKLFDNLKENIKLIDLRKDDASVSEYKKRFRFVDEGKANYFLSGFGSDAVKFLYSKVRT